MSLKRALELASTNNWDGENALAVTAEVSRNAIAISKLFDTEDVYPNPNGTISFNTKLAHLEVGKTRISAYFRDNQGTIFLDGQITYSNA